MNLLIREADFSKDRQRMTCLFQEELNPAYTQQRFNWCYDENPFGAARSWLLLENDGETFIGVATAFPRQMYVGQRKLSGWVLGDFCLRSQYRALGPALILQKRCLQDLRKNSTGPIYDFPSSTMTAIYSRLKYNPLGRMVRLVKVLKADNMIQKYMRIPILSKGLGLILNSLIEYNEKWNANKNPKLYFEEGKVLCGQEFSELANKVKGIHGICINRTAEYLNWKYAKNPLGSFEILKAKQGEELVGYLVTSVSADEGSIVDALGINFPDVVKPLIFQQIKKFLRQAVSTISFPIFEGTGWFDEIKKLGFYEREPGPFYGIFEGCENAIFDGTSGEFESWFILHGDRDA